MTTGSFGLLFGPVATFSMRRTVNMPSITLPNTEEQQAAQQTDNTSEHAATNSASQRLVHQARLSNHVALAVSIHSPTCLLSSHSALLHVMKNWHPFVLGPEFA